MKILIYRLILLTFLVMNLASAAQEQPIVLKTGTGDIFGTLLMPEGLQKAPVTLMISGSGPTDRDGNQPNLKNNSLKFLAGELAKEGIASVRFDKRLIGESAGAATSEKEIRFENYIEDVKAWIGMLASDQRFSKIIVAGHSEGSLIGMVASEGNKNAGAFISIEGAGQSADLILKKQLNAAPQQVKDMVFPMIETLKKGDTIANVPQMLFSLFRPSVQPYMISWFRYDPQAEIKKLTVPALIINGDRDVQTSPEDAGFLSEAKPDAVKIIIHNMNHILKDCETSDMMQQITIYNNPDLPVKKELVSVVAEFIKKL